MLNLYDCKALSDPITFDLIYYNNLHFSRAGPLAASKPLR